MKVVYLLLFVIAVLASFGEVDKPFRSGVIVKNIEWTVKSSSLNKIFPFSNADGWLVFSSKINVDKSPSDLDVTQMLCAYFELHQCRGKFSFVSELIRARGTEDIVRNSRVVIFVRRNELVYVSAKVVNFVFLVLLLVLVLLGETDEKTSYKKLK